MGGLLPFVQTQGGEKAMSLPKSSASSSPETDALANEIYARGIRVSEIRMLKHARSLERERNAALSVLRELVAQSKTRMRQGHPARDFGLLNAVRSSERILDLYPQNATMQAPAPSGADETKTES